MNFSLIQQHRNGLARTQKALAAGTLRLGFIGGSITAPYYYNWPEGVISWFAEHFSNVRLHVDNVAIGATGSQLAVFRAQRDLIDKGCDLVFVEYAVNDRGADRQTRRRTQEGLVRKLLAGEGRDVVFTYTFCPEMYEDMAAGRVPQSILDLDEIAAHYGIGSVWMGLHAFKENQSGRMRWEEWLPDGLHTRERGSWSYAQAVFAYLEKELLSKTVPTSIPAGSQRPAPLDPAHWESAASFSFDDVKLTGPWTLRLSPRWWADRFLETAAVGARMEFTFEGRALCLGFDFGKSSSEFRYRLDGADWVTSNRKRPSWCPESDWFQIYPVSENLAPGSHHIEIEVVHGNRPECTGTNFRLALIGIVT
ncbi:MAG: SGNH/GDSL hydrolase family protein [Opitutaceae bacterium]|jgi:hypothetical protein